MLSHCIYAHQNNENNNTSSNISLTDININNNYDKNNYDKNNDQLKKVVRIISLNGGGTRGYAQVGFLDKLCKTNKIKDIPKYFNLIAGTSIGALNAALLANGMTPEEIVKFFREVSPWIFTIRSFKDLLSNNASIPSNKPNKIQKLLLIMFNSPFYKSVSENSNYGDARLRRELTKIFGDRLLTSLKVPVLFTAYNDSKSHPVIFTNLDLKGISCVFRNVKIVDALMASMSAPFYFPSTDLYLSQNKQEKPQKIMDGVLFQNNPSLLAFTIARVLYPLAERYCILNVGTGSGRVGLNPNTDVTELSNTQFAKYNRLYTTAVANGTLMNNIFFTANSNISTNQYISYYCFNFKLDKNRACSFDTSTSEFFDYLDNEVEKQYKHDYQKIKEFIEKSNAEDVK